VPVVFRDEIGALLRPRAPVLLVLVPGSLLAACLLAFGPGDATPALDGATAILLLEGVGLALLLTEGVVARDLRRGWAALWLQKPVSPVAFYLARFLRAAAAAAVLTGTSAAVLALAFELGRGEGVRILEILPVALLFGATLAVLTFGLSAWRAHPDVLMALAFVFLSTPLSAMASVNPGAFGPAGPLFRAVAPPFDPIIAVGGVLMEGPAPTAGDVGHVAAYLGAWIAVGVAGLLRTTRNPFL